jgi:hypothetical protein
MNENPPQINAELKPKRSAVFTLGSFLVSSLMIFSGVWYIANEDYLAGTLLFIPGLVGGFFSYLLGFKTSKNQDLQSGLPFAVQATDTSVQISADPRTSQDTLLRLISVAADVMRNRKPLPEASGMVSADGAGDASRKKEANEKVREINREIDEDNQRISNALTIEEKIDQSVIDRAPKRPTQDKGAEDA